MSDNKAGITVAAAWRDEMQRRRVAYAARRARWTQAWHRGGQPEPPIDTDNPSGRLSRTIHDRRQFRFDFSPPLTIRR